MAAPTALGAQGRESGSVPVVSLPADGKTIALSPYTLYYWQTSKKADPVQTRQMILEHPFEEDLGLRRFRDHRERPGFGFKKDVLWLRIALVNPHQSDLEYVLEYDYPGLDDLRVWQFAAGKPVYEWDLGMKKKFGERPLAVRDFSLPVNLKPGEPNVFVLRVESRMNIRAPVRITGTNAFSSRVVAEYALLFFLIGTILSVVLYNGVLWFSLRDSVYSNYFLFGVLLALFLATQHGLAFQFLWPYAPEFAVYAKFLVFDLVFVYMLRFCRAYLELNKRSPLWDRILKTQIFLMAIPVVLVMAGFFQGAAQAHTLIFLLIVVSEIWAGISVLRRGFRPAGYFLLAEGGLLVGAVLFLLYVNGLVGFDHILFEYGVYLGIVSQMTLLSFGLAYRLRLDREDKVLAETRRRAQSDFYSRLGHEIRNPLNVILGLAEALEVRLKDEETARLVRQLAGSGRALRGIVDDLLDLARVESGKITLVAGRFSVPVFFEDLCQQYGELARRKGLEFRSHLSRPDAMPERLAGDSLKMRQVLANLLDNAIKYTDQGSVGFSSRLIAGASAHPPGEKDKNNPGSARPENCLLEFQISDTGAGMTSLEQEHIFDAFDRAGHSNSAIKGTGLGLAISRELTRFLGGDLRLVSAPGKGTSFTAWFPVEIPATSGKAPRPEPERSPSPPSEKALPGARVLLADDDDGNRLLARTWFRHWGANLVTVGDGRKALEKFTRGEWDLVLLDLNMPEMDGWQALKRIREWEQNKGRFHTPVIAVTGHVAEQDRRETREAGFDDHLAKPVEWGKLPGKIRHWIDTRPDN